jgi:hypothetical protein
MMDDEKPATITASPSTSGMKSSLYMGLTTRQLGFKPGCNALPVTFEAAAEDQLVSQKTYADTVNKFYKKAFTCKKKKMLIKQPLYEAYKE